MWYNRVVKWILRSPLHPLLSHRVMLITVTGRISGHQYCLPVNYRRDGDGYCVISSRDRTWWRNLRRDAVATVLVQGRLQSVCARVLEDDVRVAAGLQAYLERTPSLARYFGVALDPEGHPEVRDVARAARSRVILRIHPVHESSAKVPP